MKSIYSVEEHELDSKEELVFGHYYLHRCDCTTHIAFVNKVSIKCIFEVLLLISETIEQIAMKLGTHLPFRS